MRRWHQLIHLHIYSYRLVKKCFLKIYETSKCHNFFIFQRKFYQVFTVLFEIFYSFTSEIKLNLLWSSPLSIRSMVRGEEGKTINTEDDLEGVFQHCISFWMPLHSCNLRFWASKWNPLPLKFSIAHCATQLVMFYCKGMHTQRSWI